MNEDETVEPKIEGGGSSWWHVCPECRTIIDTKDETCPGCKRRINWDGLVLFSRGTEGSVSGNDRVHYQS